MQQKCRLHTSYNIEVWPPDIPQSIFPRNDLKISWQVWVQWEKEHKLSFLDVSIDKSNANIITRIYRKVTFSGVLTNYLSFTPMKYKIE